MIESHIRAQYRLYEHTGFYTRVGSLDCHTKEFENQLVFGEQGVLDYARKWDGKRNCFIGRSKRDANGKVVGCTVTTFDLDPIRPKGTASTTEQHEAAVAAGRRILKEYSGGYLSSSGNGCLLIYYTGEVCNEIGYYSKESVLIDELQKLVGEYNVKIDKTNYSEALTKIIGTLSTKGEMSLRRCSRFFEYPIPPFRNCEKLLQRLAEIKPTKSLTLTGIDVEQIMSKYGGDRSLADFHLVRYLKQAGVGPADALKALQTNPLGRKEERPDDWQRLISKIYGDIPRDNKTGYFERLFEVPSDSPKSIKTGFAELDRELGPLPMGELAVFAARSGYGKSTFACTLAERLRTHKKVLYFSTEMHRDYIMHKLTAIATETPLSKLVQKDVAQYKPQITEYSKIFNNRPIIICDDFQPTLDRVRNLIIAEKPDLVIFDHINQADTHWENLAKYIRGLKELTKDQECVTLVLAQLNEPPRDPKTGNEQQSLRSDCRGTQEIIHLSSIFVFMTNPFLVKGQYQPVQFHIAKNRYGISGQVVDLVCDKYISKFIEGEKND